MKTTPPLLTESLTPISPTHNEFATYRPLVHGEREYADNGDSSQ
jgi:hypothetical protein